MLHVPVDYKQYRQYIPQNVTQNPEYSVFNNVKKADMKSVT